jgi:hypothetical protein
MLVSNYGNFATNFTQETCQHYYMMAPIFKGLSCQRFTCQDSIDHTVVIQTMVSQVILGVRYDNLNYCIASCTEFYIIQDMEYCKERQADRNGSSVAILHLDYGEFPTYKPNICNSPRLARVVHQYVRPDP